ncbi:2Fe-2S iron-sulfur cluster-binding protein, partial [Caballeronia sp. NCTM5]|uniref:2Fe-2S iron-sulfur cluster-binding protein n=1 Tax=Caballeronia sp. NCTM5 TaxID=2921755 RepID=UPI0020297EE9
VREMLSGHICRCTGYTPIVAAVLDVGGGRRPPPPPTAVFCFFPRRVGSRVRSSSRDRSL